MDDSEQDLRARKKPNPPIEELITFTNSHWQLSIDTCTVKRLESYDDANYYCEGSNGNQYLVKVYNAVETRNPQILNGLSNMLLTINNGLHDYGNSNTMKLEVPSIVQPASIQDNNNAKSHDNVDYRFIDNCLVMDNNKERLAVRVFKWIQGDTLDRRVKTATSSKRNSFNFFATLASVGESIGSVSSTLTDFDDEAFHRKHLWDLQNLELSMPLLPYVIDEDSDSKDRTQQCIQSIRSLYNDVVMTRSEELPMSVIMGDCNDANIIIQDFNSNDEKIVKVTGLIDFSDSVYTWTINELAIGMAYCLLTTVNFFSDSKNGNNEHYNLITALGAVLVGYVTRRKLSDSELHCLPVLVATRLCISITIGAYAISKEPENDYLRLHAIPARKVLSFLCTDKTYGADVSYALTALHKYFSSVQARLPPLESSSVDVSNNLHGISYNSMMTLLTQCYQQTYK